jgi:hypothetical protein
MKLSRIAGGLLACGLLVGTALAADSIKSGPQAGEKLAGPFHPLNINGPTPNEKQCLYCRNGENPVAMIFAREVSEPLVNLIKKIDACNAKNTGCNMGSFVVFLSDDEGLQSRLKELAKTANLQHTVLSIDNPAGPQGYKVARDADVTVVLYTNRTVKVNHAFKKGEMKDSDVEKIVTELPKILPNKS